MVARDLRSRAIVKDGGELAFLTGAKDHDEGNLVAKSYAQAIGAGKKPDFAKYTTTASFSAEELAKLVKTAADSAGRRF